MINLLPKDDQRQLRAARSNTLLLRYNIALLFAAAFMGIAIITIYLFLVNTHQTAETTIAENQAKVNDYSAVQSQAEAYRKNLADAKSLFDQEIKYSKLYTEIARLMPVGTALESLALNSASIDAPLELSVKIRGENQAKATLAAFQSSEVFNNNASYGALTMNGGDDKKTYPYIITVKVAINKGAIK